MNKRYKVTIFGVVQGVGYRPYVYQQAKKYGIRGWVNNQGSALVMDIEGAKKDIKQFLKDVVKKPPRLAIIDKIMINPKEIYGYLNFKIVSSMKVQLDHTFIGTDIAICQDCLKDIMDKNNLRFHYAFTNCTSCGPRYSIIHGLPYDRENTTMESFQMCTDCSEEYHNPSNRRFHAQPNCCPKCGPTLSLFHRNGKEIYCDNPIEEGIKLLESGEILAIKGLGGFHLSCNARDNAAVQKLRERKGRPDKPFAIMVKDLQTVRELCELSSKEEEILTGHIKPIVILNKKNDSTSLSPQVAPRTSKLGIMLPYTPLHYLLFQKGITALVMTSGNHSNEPIQYRNEQAFKKLSSIANYFLIHNRNIHTSQEDSVVKVIRSKQIIIRRGRGFSPFIVPFKVKHNILALGGDLKSTFCLSHQGYGYMSQYLGDLKDTDAFENYQNTLWNLQHLIGSKPDIIASDLHTGYISSSFGNTLNGKQITIQHHHAHMVSCMAEHNLNEPVIGVVYDGTGMGTDGKIWGGEFFVGTRKVVARVGHFRYVTLQGGDSLMKEPWKIALCYLKGMYLSHHYLLPRIESDIEMISNALKNRLNCYETSSVGRLFDCIAALLGLCSVTSYDAQAAIELENIIDYSCALSYDYKIINDEGNKIIDYEPIIRSVIKDIENSLSPAIISAKFHNTIGRLTVETVLNLCQEHSLSKVVLSGGVFENNYLLNYIVDQLEDYGLSVYIHQQIPTNDSGISVGQIAIADAMEEG